METSFGYDDFFAGLDMRQQPRKMRFGFVNIDSLLQVIDLDLAKGLPDYVWPSALLNHKILVIPTTQEGS